MKLTRPIIILRVIHGLFTLFFALCLIELYYAAVTRQTGVLLVISVISLAIEGAVVFIFNRGDCPLIHIQRKIGDDKPFFELFLPSNLARKAIPYFAILTLLAVGLLVVRLL